MTTKSPWRALGLGLLVVVLALCLGVVLWVRNKPVIPRGATLDEALEAGRDASSFPAADADYFHDMDGGVRLTPEEIKGRNSWTVWTAGNDRFWDGIGVSAYGALDFLKTISTHPSLTTSRDHRRQHLG